MGFKSAAVAAKVVAAGLMVAAWAASAGVASADPGPTPTPTPSPGPSRGPAPGPAAAGPKTTIDKDGVYVVGKDILPGTYSTAGPVGNGTCYWKRMGNPDGNLIDNNLTKKPQVVQIEATDKAFKTNGCQPWQTTDAAPPAAASGPLAGLQLQGNLAILNGLLGPSGQRLP